MNNCLCEYLIENILYEKKSVSEAVIQLTMQQYNKLIKQMNLLKIKNIDFDLSRVFDTVDHSILLKKLELYGITGRNHEWVKSHLSNRRQFIQIEEK